MKIRKLLTAALVLVMVFAAIPVLSIAEGASAVTHEARQMSKLNAVWAALDAAELKALSTARVTKNDVINAVYQAALNLKDVDKDSFSDFTEDGFFFTVDGMYCAYSYRLSNELKPSAISVPASEEIQAFKADTDAEFTRGGNGPSSPHVLFIAPYYGLDENTYHSTHRSETKSTVDSIANATGGSCKKIEGTKATGPVIAQNVTNKGVIIFDTHGLQSSSTSYICLTTTSGINTNDYSRGWAIRTGNGAGIDGRYIENHKSGNLANCFVWLGMCQGMKKEGKGTTGSALIRSGAACVLGYSQIVYNLTVRRSLASFWSKMMENGATVAQAVQTMKNSIGVCDPIAEYRVNTSSGVYLRSGAGTNYQIIGAIPNGTSIVVTEKRSNWGKTTYNGKTGWVCLDYCVQVSKRAYPIVMSTTDSFPSNPDANQTVTCSWKLRGGNSSYSTGEYRVISTNGVNLRSGAGTNYSIVSAIPYGTTITVTQVSGNWGKTTYNGKTGWVCLDYCQYVSQPTTWTYRVIATDGLNIRSGAGTNYSILGAIPYGKIITVTQNNGRWGKTTYNGITGWVCLDYCAEILAS